MVYVPSCLLHSVSEPGALKSSSSSLHPDPPSFYSDLDSHVIFTNNAIYVFFRLFQVSEHYHAYTFVVWDLHMHWFNYRVKLDPQYDAGPSVTSRASGWCWSWLKFNSSFNSPALVSVQSDCPIFDIGNWIWPHVLKRYFLLWRLQCSRCSHHQHHNCEPTLALSLPESKHIRADASVLSGTKVNFYSTILSY